MSDAVLASSPVLAPIDVSQSRKVGLLGTSKEQSIDEVSQDFEAVFLSQMMGQIFAGDDMTQFFGGGTAGEVYKSYLLDEYGKSMAKSGGIGIAKQVRETLLKLQEVSYDNASAATQQPKP